MNNNIINPFREGLPKERVLESCIFILFGATGDLAKRKLIPALFNLYKLQLLPNDFKIIAYASKELDTLAYTNLVENWLKSKKPSKRELDGFKHLFIYKKRESSFEDSIKNLIKTIKTQDSLLNNTDKYLFYFAVPPDMAEKYAIELGKYGCVDIKTENGWRKIILEKPFGLDYENAKSMHKNLSQYYDESQIFRLDHYLGKESVQNILVFKFANSIFEPLLNNKYVHHIQITSAETVGLESRGGYYDETGALKDMVQNHLLQMLSLVCMDNPTHIDSESLRQARVNILKDIEVDMSTIPIRAQYSDGRFMGEVIKAYISEDGVAENSNTETYIALKLKINNSRWQGVPVFIRTGKRLAKRVGEIALVFKDSEKCLPDQSNLACNENTISIRIQPDDGISIKFLAKVPGFDYHTRPVKMDFKYGSSFEKNSPEAYERLLLDALIGDVSLFSRGDSIEECWRICDPIIKAIKNNELPMYNYKPGTWGPHQADDLIKSSGSHWRIL
ncbi:MAG: glucose-6-phosphate dehydrogenase [Armatimonadota bacterium]